VTYADVKPRAALIGVVTSRRIMPPWKPESAKGEFVDERRLTDRELATIRTWIADGAPQGDPADLPPQPRWDDGWRLGTPDLVVSMPPGFTVPAEGGDIFRTFVLPVSLSSPRFVRALEFRPGNPRVVH